MVKRIYVEKKEGFDVEAGGLMEDIRQNLNPKGLLGIRVINRYDMDGITDEIYTRAKTTIFSEPAIDCTYDEELPSMPDSIFFAVEYLPGQYDQRADSAVQCIKLMAAESEPEVRFARVIVLEGKISDNEIDAIKKYCINPVDSREASLEKPENLAMRSKTPPDVRILDGFIGLEDNNLEAFRNEMGLAMSRADLNFVKSHFKDTEKRNPTITELRVIDTYWSDHCRHTTFNTKLNYISFDEGPYPQLVKEAFEEYLQMRKQVYGDREKDISLMDIACLGAKYIKKNGLLEDLDESEEINACSIKVKAKVDGKEEDWLVMFKNETHNHPTEIEPFGGAATCLGGAIRDPLSGRVYVYQAMRVTGSGDPRKPVSETLPGKLPQRKITIGAAAGYSSYGNQIGLATGQVSEIYHEGYIAKRMEVGAVIGAAPAANVVRKSPECGDVIILVGGRTGRDGCGGATGSSKEHTEESIHVSGAEVQKGNPPVERNIQRLFRRKEAAMMIRKCNDFGAGGVSVAIGELADSIDVNLDCVLKKYEGLDGTELAISESQERMAVVVSEKDAPAFIGFADEENLEAVIVARVTDSGRFRMIWRNQKILDLSREFLNTNGVRQEAEVSIKDYENVKGVTESLEIQGLTPGMTLNEKAMSCLEDLNCCSQKGLIERFDSTIGAGTVLMPLGGACQLSPAAGMAAKLPVLSGNTDTATLMAYGFDPYLSSASPFHGAMAAVIDSVTKIAAMGGNYANVRLSFQEYFEKMTENPESWGKPFSALLGALKAQKELELPAIGGKDSMSGTFMELNVPPTLISFAVSVTDASRIISTEFKKKGSKLVLLYAEKDQNEIIDFAQYRTNMQKMAELSAAGKILSANPIGRGGIFISAVKMALGNQIGADLKNIESGMIFKAMVGALLLEIPKDADPEELFAGTTYNVIGTTLSKKEIRISTTDSSETTVISLDEILGHWTKPLENIFPARTSDYRNKEDKTKVESLSWESRLDIKPLIRVPQPRVLIPVFPGTNCEIDSRRAFEKAGGIVELHILQNLTPHALAESIRELEKKIRQSQIVMIPGGFSGGDEPDGSAKFITAVFRNPAIGDAITELLDNRDGLMLGICNGFQALIKLGLAPYGKISDTDESFPTLTYNKIGRHQSRLIRTRVASIKSPWMAGTYVGDIHTIPVSHGEGRFIAGDEVLEELIHGGQIATQYVDHKGRPSMDISYNPNYSTMAVEGITSPDGRILGKMAHSERIGQNLYKNVEGSKDQKIFESGIKYFL